MQTVSTAYTNAINALRRSAIAKVELYSGDTLVNTFDGNTISNIEVERAGEESKFFGFPVSHQATIKLVDGKRELEITQAHSFKIYAGVKLSGGTEELKPFPRMYVKEVTRDENNNELTIKVVDILDRTTQHTVSELSIAAPYTVKDYAEAASRFLSGAAPIFADETISGLALAYPEGANFEGTETLRDALTAAAEVTQTIYYVGGDDVIHFRRLDRIGAPDKVITKDIYISLKSSENRTLQAIASITELGDNLEVSTGLEGETQYVRNNPFWELRGDLDTVLNTALAEIAGISINQVECEWRGDPALEIGDKISYVTKDNQIQTTFLLSDTLTYNGGLSQKTVWNYTNGEQVSANPTGLGEVIKHTYAKVDKANKNIEIVAGEASDNKQEIAALKINTENISASVTKVQEANTDAIASLNGEINNLTKKVEATISAEDVQLQIKSELANGVDKVTTSTGFTFDENGLTVSKTGSEMTTNIDEDGMSVYRDNEEVLTADNSGVTAYNLKAKTYLIVGENSRFEDFESTDGEQRTGCFWIGGNN